MGVREDIKNLLDRGDEVMDDAEETYKRGNMDRHNNLMSIHNLLMATVTAIAFAAAVAAAEGAL